MPVGADDEGARAIKAHLEDGGVGPPAGLREGDAVEAGGGVEGEFDLGGWFCMGEGADRGFCEGPRDGGGGEKKEEESAVFHALTIGYGGEKSKSFEDFG